MIAPTLNMNGTTGESLLDDIRSAIQAINDAWIVVCRCEPHGRDYQTVSPHVYEQALVEHSERLRALTAVGQQYEELAEKILTQIKVQ